MLDTSFVVNAMFTGQDHYRECRNALIDMAEADTRMIYSSHLDVELIEASYKVALKEQHPRDWARRRPDGRCRARADRITTRMLRLWAQVMREFRTTRIDAGQVTDLVPEIMRKWGLESYDAVHVATCMRTGVQVLVAVDHDFGFVPASELRVFTVEDHVRGMRRKRAR